MKPSCAIVLVTAPNLKIARALARASLSARLAACVNLLPAIESLYWWENRITSSREILLILKTTPARLPALERLILEQHPYDTPEFLALPVSRGARRYLDWIVHSVQSAQ
jgi:periplasmic divalent cation tolerance protein